MGKTNRTTSVGISRRSFGAGALGGHQHHEVGRDRVVAAAVHDARPGLVGELLGLVVLDAGQDHLEQHGELVAALAVRADLDASTDRRVLQLHLVAAGDGVEGAVEAGGVSGGEIGRAHV